MYFPLLLALVAGVVVVAGSVAARRYEVARSKAEGEVTATAYQQVSRTNLVFQLAVVLTCFAFFAYFIYMLNLPTTRDQVLAGLGVLVWLLAALWDPDSWAHGDAPAEKNYRNLVAVMSVVWLALAALHIFNVVNIISLIGLKA